MYVLWQKQQAGNIHVCKNKVKEEGSGWYASSATERKEHMESISLVEGRQLSFYAENILFSSSTIFSSSPTPKLVSCCASPRLKTLSDSNAFKQNLYNHAKMPHPGQSHNVVIYMHADVKHDSQSGGCEFDFPNHQFLSPWSHFIHQTYSCFKLPHAWFLLLHKIDK